MIKPQSDDPNVSEAAEKALFIINDVIASQPKASQFNYGGHELKLGDYNVCITCASSIAEAQQLAESLSTKAESIEDKTVREHVILASQLLETEAQIAIIRAEFHNGHNTEPILDTLLGYVYQRKIHDTYEHSHNGKKK